MEVIHEPIRLLRRGRTCARAGLRPDSPGRSRSRRRRFARLVDGRADGDAHAALPCVRRRARRRRERPSVRAISGLPRRPLRLRLRHDLRFGVRRRRGQLPLCLGQQSPSRVQDLPRLGHRLRRRMASVPRRQRALASTSRLIEHRRQRLRLRSRAAALPGRRLVLHPGPLRRAWQRRLRIGRVLRSLLRPWRRMRRPGHLQDHRCRTGPLHRQLRVLLGCLHPGRLRRRLRPRGVFLEREDAWKKPSIQRKGAETRRRNKARSREEEDTFPSSFCASASLRLCVKIPVRSGPMSNFGHLTCAYHRGGRAFSSGMC